MSGDQTELRIGDGLTLPPDVVTQAVAILGRRGSGKTSTGVVLAEELIRQGLPVVILDPLGVWHGLRSSVDGDGPGLPVVIFGGDHADLPLPPDSGQLIADVIVDHHPPAVIDLSGLDSDAAIRRWCAAFLRRVYQRNRSPLHIVIDEADLLAPQQGAGEAAQSLNATKAVFRRGRVRGLGGTLITQRPAALAKEVLNQAEVLVALQLTGPRDVAAVDDWMSQHGDPDQVREVKASLPSLSVGESWWWSPSWLRLLRRVQVRPRETFDSSATPKAGQTRVEPTAMAQVDLEALGQQIAALQEGDATEVGTAGGGASTAAAEAEAARLRGQLADLERQLRERSTPERVEVPALTDEQIAELGSVVSALAGLAETVSTALDRVTSTAAPPPSPSAVRAQTEPRPRPPVPPRAASASDGPRLKAGARKMLDVLARSYPTRLDRGQLGTLSGYRSSGGTFKEYLSALRRNELVDEQGGLLGLTDAGLAGTDATPEPLTRGEVLALWTPSLKAGARAMLDVVLAAPGGVTRAELGERVGFVATGGTFKEYLSALRRAGLVDVDREHVKVSSTLPP